MFINSQFFRSEVHAQSARVFHSVSHKTGIKALKGSEYIWHLETSSSCIDCGRIQFLWLQAGGLLSLAVCQLGTLSSPRGHSQSLPCGSLHPKDNNVKSSLQGIPLLLPISSFLFLWSLHPDLRDHGIRSGPLRINSLLRVHCAT